MLDWKVLSVVKRKGERWGVTIVDLGTYLRDVAQKEGACQLESISLWCLHMQDRGQPGEKGTYRYDVSDTPYRYW